MLKIQLMLSQLHTIRQMAMALAGAVAIAACGGKGNGAETPSDSSGNVAVTISPDRETLYRNPFSGWVIYSGLGDVAEGRIVIDSPFGDLL